MLFSAKYCLFFSYPFHQLEKRFYSFNKKEWPHFLCCHLARKEEGTFWYGSFFSNSIRNLCLTHVSLLRYTLPRMSWFFKLWYNSCSLGLFCNKAQESILKNHTPDGVAVLPPCKLVYQSFLIRVSQSTFFDMIFGATYNVNFSKFLWF